LCSDLSLCTVCSRRRRVFHIKPFGVHSFSTSRERQYSSEWNRKADGCLSKWYVVFVVGRYSSTYSAGFANKHRSARKLQRWQTVIIHAQHSSVSRSQWIETSWTCHQERKCWGEGWNGGAVHFPLAKGMAMRPSLQGALRPRAPRQWRAICWNRREVARFACFPVWPSFPRCLPSDVVSCLAPGMAAIGRKGV
jgi:hypothetical protein